MILQPIFAAAVALAPALAVAQQPPQDVAAPAQDAAPVIYEVEVVARYPHDPQAFTQGLLWHDGHLYESTGQLGQSQIRRVDLATGEVLAGRDIPAEQFGEGLALWGDELVSLTWKDRVIHRWTLDGLEPVRSDPFPYEGWGLAVLGDALVASDGSDVLRLLDPQTYALRREIGVTIDGRPVPRINELEVADGLIWANQWYSQVIVAIDPADGAIRKIVDLGPLVDEVAAPDPGAVLNGIAHDPQTGRWFVTGKLWPTLFEVRFVPRGEAAAD
ncbi:glutaminyl-peptide cyclotransferase [Alteriqipengyuania lutimaris]|uniref:Glutaminyl-peptide cyclotransferase n=1 Tax=Alteriqipengyuania lutimaris TaxID=1538146 RepID=A0A395LPH3_9SPHN|nr:glutaminyl-peptide cyclotransferase [Alteriqipengyuania lutimaris]RDS78619.1 glutaminyl-peptide cyclotransferase [Alteriqipengyuania lutimaris]